MFVLLMFLLNSSFMFSASSVPSTAQSMSVTIFCCCFLTLMALSREESRARMARVWRRGLNMILPSALYSAPTATTTKSKGIHPQHADYYSSLHTSNPVTKPHVNATAAHAHPSTTSSAAPTSSSSSSSASASHANGKFASSQPSMTPMAKKHSKFSATSAASRPALSASSASSSSAASSSSSQAKSASPIHPPAVGRASRHHNQHASSSSSSYPLAFLSSAPSVVVCLTTLPSRVHHIDKCLASLKSQSYPLAQIILAIPEECRREKARYSIPDRIRKDACITLLHVPEDIGPATRLKAAWSHLHESAQSSQTQTSGNAAAAAEDTLIITLDDDMLYHTDTIATLVRHAIAHPDSALAFAGYSMPSSSSSSSSSASSSSSYSTPSYSSFAACSLLHSARAVSRPELRWLHAREVLGLQIRNAATQTSAQHGAGGVALVAAAAAALAQASALQQQQGSGRQQHEYQHLLSTSLDPALLPCFDPLPSATHDSSSSLYDLPPNPNDVYDTDIVDVLCAWRGGICVRKRFIDERMWNEYQNADEAAYWTDDEWY